MKVIIIEDEILSAEHLGNMLRKIDTSIEIVAQLDSVKRSVEILQQGLEHDLIFLDIHLADGLGFDIFEKIQIDTPIIFTTAYNEYALKAFEVNSVDYLLKPIAIDDLRRAIDKFNKYNRTQAQDMLKNISKAYHQLTKQYKTRFMVKIGNTIDSIKTEDIQHFITQDGITFLVIANGKRYPVDYTLDQIEELMSPEDYFRMNRKVVISIKSIQKVNTYSNSRLAIQSAHLEGDAMIVSRERVNDFKAWLDR